MKRVAAMILILFLFSLSLHSFGFSLVEVLGLLKKISGKISDYNGLMEKYSDQFEDFFQTRWMKYYSKPSLKKAGLFSEPGDRRVYEGPHIDPHKMEPRWRRIFSNPSLLRDEFPSIFNFDSLRESPNTAEPGGPSELSDKNIAEAKEYLKAVQTVLTLLHDTRRLQVRRGEKACHIREYIKNFTMPKGKDEVRMGRLIALEAAIDHEIHKQYVELITLINAGTEINVKSMVMGENFRNRNYRNRLAGDQQ